MLLKSAAIAIFISIGIVEGLFAKNVSEVLAREYDFVIVGGGTAGLVVANRLTEQDFVVLVLEAGGMISMDRNVTVPFFCQYASPSTIYDWNYTTVPQQNLDGRQVSYQRGFGLGGSSSINYMVYTRGTREDYDRYAAVSEDPGWGWDAMQPYFFKNEKLTQPADKHNTTGQIDPAVHSRDGINGDSLPGFHWPLEDLVVNVTKELPYDYPYNIDMNSGINLGVGWTLSTILGGARSSSATSYLGPEFLARKNLDILLNAKVTRLVRKSGQNETVKFSTLDFVVNGQEYSVNATKEVVLSAGTVNTPYILMHSGIGNASELSSAGINPILDLPSVGKNLTDHTIVPSHWTVNSTDTFENFTRNPVALSTYLEQWQESRTGPLVDTIGNQLAWLRLADNDSLVDPSAGLKTAQYELVFSNGFVGPVPAVGNYLTIGSVLVSPSSRGSVRINTTDPMGAPVIDQTISARTLIGKP